MEWLLLREFCVESLKVHSQSSNFLLLSLRLTFQFFSQEV